MDLNEKYCSQANTACVILTYSLAVVLELLWKKGAGGELLLKSVPSSLMYISRNKRNVGVYTYSHINNCMFAYLL